MRFSLNGGMAAIVHAKLKVNRDAGAGQRPRGTPQRSGRRRPRCSARRRVNSGDAFLADDERARFSPSPASAQRERVCACAWSWRARGRRFEALAALVKAAPPRPGGVRDLPRPSPATAGAPGRWRGAARAARHEGARRRPDERRRGESLGGRRQRQRVRRRRRRRRGPRRLRLRRVPPDVARAPAVPQRRGLLHVADSAEIKFSRRIHAIDATPARWRADVLSITDRPAPDALVDLCTGRSAAVLASLAPRARRRARACSSSAPARASPGWCSRRARGAVP